MEVATASFERLINARSKLTTAALAAWILLLNVTIVYGSGQKCYGCGPLASQWYPNGTSPSCEDFSAAPQFEIDCGDGYRFCAIIKIPGAQNISRACTENHDPKACVPKAHAKTATLYTVCSCNGTLCNKDLSINSVTESSMTTLPNEKSQTTEPTTIKIEFNTKSHEEEKTTMTTKMEPHVQATHNAEPTSQVTPTKQPNNKTKETKAERDIPADADHKHEMVTVHSLPLPEALGQENKKKTRQGAPVDDEEDTAEGSGSRIENDNRSHNPTTTQRAQVRAEITTTAQSPKNNAPSLKMSYAVSFIVWTLLAIINIA